MKKIALFSLMLSVFSFSALGGEVWCGVECNSDNDGKFLVCPGVFSGYRLCDSTGIWSPYPPYSCSGVSGYRSAPTGFNNIGEWNDNVLVWVKKEPRRQEMDIFLRKIKKKMFVSHVVRVLNMM